LYQPKFSYSQSIVKDLMSIERSRAIVELMPIPAHIESDLKEKGRGEGTRGQEPCPTIFPASIPNIFLLEPTDKNPRPLIILVSFKPNL